MTKRSKKNLMRNLKEQVSFMISSCQAYDRGAIAEAKRLSVTVRMLVHDTSSSTSLLGQLDSKVTASFYNTAPKETPRSICGYFGLIGLAMRPNIAGVFAPRLDNLQKVAKPYMVPFAEWWDTVVIRDEEGKTFSRKEIILNIANKDGGAHVDPRLNKAYSMLSNGQTVGWQGVQGGKIENVRFIELATARQIAHEVLGSLARNMPSAFEEQAECAIYTQPQKPADIFTPDGIMIFNIAMEGTPANK